jgi:hypothetical protein
MGKREEVVSRRVRDVHLYMCQSSRIILVFMLCVNMSQLLHSSYERHNLSIVVVVLKIVIR